jgi:small subunit ribosomal protein S4
MNKLSLKKINYNVVKEKPTRFTEISIVGSKTPKKVNMPKKQNTLTEYQSQYKAKQQIKEFYGNLSETALKNLMKTASYSLLPVVCEIEKRLDVVVFRLGFARSILESRSLIKGGFVKIDDKAIGNNSMTKRVSVGSKITVDTTEISYLAKIQHLKLNLVKMPTHLYTPYTNNLKGNLITQTPSNFKLEGYLIKNPIESEVYLPYNFPINKLRLV